jgi:hypothetical protein
MAFMPSETLPGWTLEYDNELSSLSICHGQKMNDASNPDSGSWSRRLYPAVVEVAGKADARCKLLFEGPKH